MSGNNDALMQLSLIPDSNEEESPAKTFPSSFLDASLPATQLEATLPPTQLDITNSTDTSTIEETQAPIKTDDKARVEETQLFPSITTTRPKQSSVTTTTTTIAADLSQTDVVHLSTFYSCESCGAEFDQRLDFQNHFIAKHVTST